MVTFFEADLFALAVHHVGNPLQDERYVLSESTLDVGDPLLKGLLMGFFLNPFQKTNQVYEFMHPSGDLRLNDAYALCNRLFSDEAELKNVADEFAKLLYSTSNHPRIKAGELYVALIDSLQIEGELLRAIGLFKSEHKEPYLSVVPSEGNLELVYESRGVNLSKLDKGCLIFQTDQGKGYKVVVVDSAKDTGYWKDEYLTLAVRKDGYTHTGEVLSVFKNFVTHKLEDTFEVSQSDKADLLNRGIKYFKEKDAFELEEFAGEVIGSPQAIEAFNLHFDQYNQEYETKIPVSFEISDAAVKKQSASFKRLIKLDRNFRIHIDGRKELIEKGFDAEKSLNYYKLYFREEHA